MLEEMELIMLASGIGVLGFVLWNRAMLSRIPNYKLLTSSYLSFLIAWIMTVLESYAIADIANFAEHFLYALGSVLLFAWCYLTFYKRKDDAF